MPSNSGMCGVCDLQPRKYKCPTCLIHYCSGPCFTAHKAACVKVEVPQPPPTREQQIDKILKDSDDAGAHVPIDRLERLAQSEAIRTAVRDPRLQRLLLTIDSSPDPTKTLEEVKKAEGAPFAALLDEMLVTIGAAQRVNGGVVFTGLEREDGASRGLQSSQASQGGSSSLPHR